MGGGQQQVTATDEVLEKGAGGGARPYDANLVMEDLVQMFHDQKHDNDHDDAIMLEDDEEDTP